MGAEEGAAEGGHVPASPVCVSILVLGQAFPQVAAVSDPIGWAFILWGGFLYWWAGALYLRQTLALLAESAQPAPGASDTLGS